jgi:hypothetical protein
VVPTPEKVQSIVTIKKKKKKAMRGLWLENIAVP